MFYICPDLPCQYSFYRRNIKQLPYIIIDSTITKVNILLHMKMLNKDLNLFFFIG